MKVQTRRTLFTGLLVLFFAGCQTEVQTGHNPFSCHAESGVWRDLPECRLYPIRRAESVSDSIIFGYIPNFLVKGNRMYIPDEAGGRLIVADTSFRLVRTIGRKGEGPGEFDQPLRLWLAANGWLWADGHGKGFLAHDTLGRLKASVKYKGRMLSRFFADEQARVWTSMPGETEGDILVFDTTSRVVKGIPNRFEHVPAARTEDLSRCHLMPASKNTFYALSLSEAIIRLFDLNGELIGECNLHNHPLIQQYFEDCERKKRTFGGDPDKVAFVLFQDAAVINENTLYLLMYYYEGEPPDICIDRVLVLDFASCQPLGTYRLLTPGQEKAFFQSLAVANGRLYAYDVLSSSFYVYALEAQPDH